MVFAVLREPYSEAPWASICFTKNRPHILRGFETMVRIKM